MITSQKIISVFRIAPEELRQVLWSFIYFFCVLASYYILRPLREEMGVATGVDQLHWLFTAVFVVMLLMVPVFGWITSRFPRRRFVPWVYVFFVCNVLVFYVVFTVSSGAVLAEQIFFVWVSVFNLFVVSVFWSFMSDIYNTEQAQRLFGFIAAGGSAGAISGPLLTASLVNMIGVNALLLVSALLLIGALVSIRFLLGLFDSVPNFNAHGARAKPIGGSVFAGAGLVFQSRFLFLIAVYTILATMSGSILYLQQANIVSGLYDNPEQRTQLFAMVDLCVNVLTVLFQVFLTGRIVSNIGADKAVRILPVLVFVGMLLLAFSPALGVVLLVQVVRRATAFSVAVPTVNMLFTVVSAEQRYKAKNFIDTVMYRLGDLCSSWIFNILKSAGFNLVTIALVGASLGAAWILVAWVLGREFRKHSQLN